MFRTLVLSYLVCLLATVPAQAQQPAPTVTPQNNGFDQQVTIESETNEEVNGHTINCGRAVWEMQGGVKFFADCIDFDRNEHRLVARGNVVFTNPEGRIAAESAEFDTQTGLGTFHQASGLMSLGPKADRRQFGNQDPDVYFWGDTIEKLGPRKYYIVAGGFTTCVQPTPRWELHTGNVTMNLDQYAIAHNTVLRVKGVPLLYMPIVYYPIQQNDRATGFLLPTYGASTLRGQGISNAFFWAINRSQDATFFHDWFSRVGQGFGTEYRYVAGPQSNGNVRYYLLDQHAAQYVNNDTVTTLEPTLAFEVTGNATHVLSPKTRLRARVDFVSNFLTQQLYSQSVGRSTNSTRSVDGNVTTALGIVNVNAAVQLTQAFASQTFSTLYGGTPRVNATIGQRQIFGLPIYAGLNSEFAYLPNRRIVDGVVTVDNSVARVDVSPVARMPLSKLTFLTVNSSAAFRTTYYSRRLDQAGLAVDQPLTRQFLELSSGIIGPVLTKIWDTPNSTRSQRMKHVIEPTLTVDYFTKIADVQAVPLSPTDPSDKIFGGLAQFTYGLNNRLFFRSRPSEGTRSSTREFVTVGVQQTYYTNPDASLTDPQYTTHTRAQEFSPVALTARFSPTTFVDANSRLEYDARALGLQLLSFGGSMAVRGTNSNLTFSRTLTSALQGPSTFLSASTSMTFRQNRFRTLYALSWDIARGIVVSQRASGAYLAQCCGVELEVQNYNYAQSSGAPISQDRRINVSFILAGLGTFSNFFGAFGGQR